MTEATIISLPAIDDSPPAGWTEASRGIPPDVLHPGSRLLTTPRLGALGDVEASAQRGLDWFRSILGTGEEPPGSNNNFLTRWFGVGPVAWCDITVSRYLIECGFGTLEAIDVPGVDHDYYKGTCYVPSDRQHWIDAGLYNQTPKVGSLAVFFWGPGTPIGDHIGVVEAWVDLSGAARTDDFDSNQWDGSLITLEGNSGDEAGRHRRTMAVIDGFGYPPFTIDSSTPSRETDMSNGNVVIKYPVETGWWISDGIVRRPTNAPQRWLDLGYPLMENIPEGEFNELHDLREVVNAVNSLAAEVASLPGGSGPGASVDPAAVADRVAKTFAAKLGA